MSFANQVAVVTGASSGIGWALARELARQGCKVGLVARRQDRLDALAEEVRRAGGTAAVAPADVGDRAQTVAAIREVGATLGPVDLLVANAGVGMPTLLEPLNVADVETMFRVNVLGVVYSFEAVLPEMLRRGQGHLAAISSLAGYRGLPGESGYSASKAAVINYLDGLRIHLRSRGIAVTTICPGFIRTPMVESNPSPMPWIMEADEAARQIVRALRRRRKVYNFPWQMTWLTKLSAWFPDRLIAHALLRYERKPPQPPIVP